MDIYNEEEVESNVSNEETSSEELYEREESYEEEELSSEDGSNKEIANEEELDEEIIIDEAFNCNQMSQTNDSDFAPYFSNITEALLFCWIQKHNICMLNS